MLKAQWDELLALRVAAIGPVPPFDCMVLARIVGPCSFRFYTEEDGAWLEISWGHGDSVILGVED